MKSLNYKKKDYSYIISKIEKKFFNEIINFSQLMFFWSSQNEELNRL